MESIADFRRAAVTGSRWMCINRHLPHLSGLRTITGGTSALRYTGMRVDGTAFTDGRLAIPNAADVRIEGDSLHMLSEPGSGRVIWTWTLLPATAQAAALKPPTLFAACPVRRELRGPADKPWCVYDTVYDRPVDADGLPGTDAIAYFASQAEAEALAEQLWPRGAEFDMYGIATPTGDWAYAVDDSGVVYGDGPWPFHDDEDGGPRSVRLSPDTTYYSWRNEHVGVWPRRFGRAAATLTLYVRRRGSGAVVVACKVTFDLLSDTFSIDGSCPPQLREQASSLGVSRCRLIKVDGLDLHAEEPDAHRRHTSARHQTVVRRVRPPRRNPPSAVEPRHAPALLRCSSSTSPIRSRSPAGLPRDRGRRLCRS
jgi:hypothetical protein